MFAWVKMSLGSILAFTVVLVLFLRVIACAASRVFFRRKCDGRGKSED